MVETFDRELERQLGRVRQGRLEPYEFRRWFASALWAAEASADEDTLTVAYEIENIVAERSGEHITDHEMLAALRSAAVASFGAVPGAAQTAHVAIRR